MMVESLRGEKKEGLGAMIEGWMRGDGGEWWKDLGWMRRKKGCEERVGIFRKKWGKKD